MKNEFANTLQRERQLSSEFQAKLEAKMQQQKDTDAKLLQQQQKLLEAVTRERDMAIAVKDREVQLARDREDRVRDELAEALSRQKDGDASVGQMQSQLRSFGLALERLKKKLAEETAARDQETASHAAQLERWKEEIDTAHASKTAAEQRVARVAELERQVAALKETNALLEATARDSQSGKEDFVYSVQCANERLKEKLRLSEESKLELINVRYKRFFGFGHFLFGFRTWSVREKSSKSYNAVNTSARRS